MDLCLVSRFFDARNGGIGRYSLNLYNSLSSVDSSDFKIADGLNIKKVSIDNLFFKGTSFFSYFYGISFGFKHNIPKNCDVYHALSPLEALSLDYHNSVVTVHDVIPVNASITTDKKQTMADKLIKEIMDKSLKHSVKFKRVVAVSEETAFNLSKTYDIDYEDITVVRQAIIPGLKADFLKNDSFTIGTISNLNPRKRVDILIKSFLKANIPNSKLKIGGRGPELEKLKKLANNDSRIEFLGFISDDNINDFYNSLDIFVFPSSIEGYGLPIVEAMACGKPVITLEDAEIPKEIKNRTIISKKENLADLIKSSEFKSNIKDNIKFAQSHSLENISKEMMKIYGELY